MHTGNTCSVDDRIYLCRYVYIWYIYITYKYHILYIFLDAHWEQALGGRQGVRWRSFQRNSRYCLYVNVFEVLYKYMMYLFTCIYVSDEGGEPTKKFSVLIIYVNVSIYRCIRIFASICIGIIWRSFKRNFRYCLYV